MSRKQFRARSKKVQKLGRDGLIEQDKATGQEKRISQRAADILFGPDRTPEQGPLRRTTSQGRKPRQQPRPAPPSEAVRTDVPDVVRSDAATPGAPDVTRYNDAPHMPDVANSAAPDTPDLVRPAAPNVHGISDPPPAMRGADDIPASAPTPSVRDVTYTKKQRRKPFQLPEASRFPSAVLGYLQGRGIHPDIISACIRDGILYESRRHRNCVFVGRDPAGHARSACLRGTWDSFRIDVEGSDKRYNFSLLAADPKCPRLAVAESPIDVLSLAALVKLTAGDWQDSHYISLGGTAPRAMIQFLCDHPHITQVSLCLDNDRAGIEGMDRLENAIRGHPVLSQRVKLIYRNPPPAEYGKDYNEFLCAHIQAVRQKQRQREGTR